jgi:hypothetical protein
MPFETADEIRDWDVYAKNLKADLKKVRKKKRFVRYFKKFVSLQRNSVGLHLDDRAILRRPWSIATRGAYAISRRHGSSSNTRAWSCSARRRANW